MQCEILGQMGGILGAGGTNTVNQTISRGQVYCALHRILYCVSWGSSSIYRYVFGDYGVCVRVCVRGIGCVCMCVCVCVCVCVIVFICVGICIIKSDILITDTYPLLMSFGQIKYKTEQLL